MKQDSAVAINVTYTLHHQTTYPQMRPIQHTTQKTPQCEVQDHEACMIISNPCDFELESSIKPYFIKKIHNP